MIKRAGHSQSRIAAIEGRPEREPEPPQWRHECNPDDSYFRKLFTKNSEDDRHAWTRMRWSPELNTGGRMTVGELKRELDRLSPVSDDRPIQVWMPGVRIELSARLMEDPKNPVVLLIEGNVIESVK